MTNADELKHSLLQAGHGGDYSAATAYALLVLSEKLDRIGSSIYALGNGDAASSGMGAIEHLAMKISESIETYAEAMQSSNLRRAP